MSHALVLVAVDGALARADVEREVAEQMAPFDEGDAWFRDGSRWDWWVVGGRYTGRLSGYDPTEDPRNHERCRHCDGTGDRPDLQPPAWKAQCGGCNACHGKGWSVKFTLEPHDGDVVRVGDVDLAAVAADRRRRYERSWAAAQKVPVDQRGFLYDVQPGDDEAAYVARGCASTPWPGYAFLRDRTWHEGERMGWFGCAVAAEAGPVPPGEPTIVTSRGPRGVGEARIVTYGLPADRWRETVLPGLVAALDPRTWLVAVDYHV